MAVTMSLRNKATGEHRSVSVSTLGLFITEWLPLCEQFGLVNVSHFHEGRPYPVPEALVPEIIRELSILAEAVVTTGQAWIAESIANILTAFAETNPTEWEY